MFTCLLLALICNDDTKLFDYGKAQKVGKVFVREESNM